MKIGCVGDSFSTSTWGLSWPDLVAQHLGADFVRACSSGAGNAFYVEKLHDIVKQPDIDLIIVQLTEPSRVTIGLRAWQDHTKKYRHAWPGPKNYFDPTHSNVYKDIGCYTMNVHNNAQWLNPWLPLSADKFDEFWLQQVAGTQFWNYQTLHNMLAMKALCDAYHKPVLWFSWFVAWDELFLPGYEWFRDSLRLIPGVARDIGQSMNLMYTSDGHYATEEYKQLVDAWLWPEIKKLL